MHLFSGAVTRLGILRRITLAVVLILALLSAAVPFDAASAGHLCAMECCAVLTPHAAGSCHMSMSSDGTEKSAPRQESDQHCALPQAGKETVDGIVAGVMGMDGSAHSPSDLDGVTIDASDHCKAGSNSKDLGDHSANDSADSAVTATQSFSKPCPADCGTGVLSSGVRRSRDSLALAYDEQPQPQSSGRNCQPFDRNSFINSTHCRQFHLRGPPSSLN